MATQPNADIVTRLLDGDRRALARVVTLDRESRSTGAAHPRTTARPHGRAHIVGITGSPGAGKSTLVMQLARELRRRDRSASA